MPNSFEPKRGSRVVVQKLLLEGSEIYQLKFPPDGTKVTHFLVVGRVLPEQDLEQFGKEHESFFDSQKEFRELRDKIIKYHSD